MSLMLKNHYSVLNLKADLREGPLKPDQIKFAYRQALLAHHPDKTQHPQQIGLADSAPTIDEITLAYKTLSDPKARAEYDNDLRVSQQKTHHGITPRTPGLETVDLDDMVYHEQENYWTRECRCGTGGGYVITEEDLDKASTMALPQDDHAIMVGCSGCSLSLQVVFVVDDG